MPPKNKQHSWIKNGKRTYYNKNKKGKWTAQKATKKAVRAVQKKTELKDRVDLGNAHNITTFSGSPTVGPAGSLVIVPEAMMKFMTQGDLNGQLHGNEYCPKYLNCKVKLNFEHLDPFGGDSSPYTVPQTYYISIVQGWVKINLKQAGYLSEKHNNLSSGRAQPAFGNNQDPHDQAHKVAMRALYQANFERDFLTYEKRSYQDIKVLKRFRVYGDQRKKFVIPDQGLDGAINNTIAPDKHYTFNWRMANKKQELAPITNAVANYGNPETWIPFVMTTFKGDVPFASTTKLAVEWCSHFTYSDM